MAFSVEVKPLSVDELIQLKARADENVKNLALSAKVADSPSKLVIRDLLPRDIYSEFNGKSGVTLNLANSYEWKWSFSGATAGSELTLIDVPSSILADWYRAAHIFYLALLDPAPKFSEIRFYKENNVVVNVPLDSFDEFGTMMIHFKPNVTYTRTDTSFKVTAIPTDSSGEVYLVLGGRVALPTGISGEPNPKVVAAGRI